MRVALPLLLCLVALIHALPLAGALGGLPVTDPNLEILLRHRAVLFGVVAGLLAAAAWRPELVGAALVAGLVSVGSFLVVVALVGQPNEALRTVARVDVVALMLLLVAAALHLRAPASINAS
jgi:peptidoglycan/LPS O-acetylase OafA/YrhL